MSNIGCLVKLMIPNELVPIFQQEYFPFGEKDLVLTQRTRKLGSITQLVVYVDTYNPSLEQAQSLLDFNSYSLKQTGQVVYHFWAYVQKNLIQEELMREYAKKKSQARSHLQRVRMDIR